MKKFFVCTDFSECSAQTIDYAVGLAQETGAELILFHGFLVTTSPRVHTPPATMMDEVTSLREQDILAKLKKIADKYATIKYLYNRDNQKVKFSFLTHNGLPEDDIPELAERENADLILMGAKGKTALERVFLGSVTHAIIRENLPCPVLAIPKNAIFKTPKHIVFASQFSEKEFRSVDHLIEEWGNRFDAKITCLHIDSPMEDNPTAVKFKDKYFFTPSSRMDYERFTSDEVAASIHTYLTRKNADIIALLTYRRGFFEEMFHHSQTENILQQAKLPILIYKNNE